MKYALFIVDRRGSGKSTIIRSLTGLGRIKRKHTWNVKARNGQPLKALVLHKNLIRGNILLLNFLTFSRKNLV